MIFCCSCFLQLIVPVNACQFLPMPVRFRRIWRKSNVCLLHQKENLAMFKASRAKYEENNDRRRKFEIVGSLSLRHFYAILRAQIVCWNSVLVLSRSPLCVCMADVRKRKTARTKRILLWINCKGVYFALVCCRVFHIFSAWGQHFYGVVAHVQAHAQVVLHV